MGIGEIIKRVFFGSPPQPVTQLTPAPDLATLNKRLAEENAQLKAELLRLKSDLAKINYEKVREKQEREEIEAIFRYKKMIEEQQKKKKLLFLLPKMKNYPTFFLRSNLPYKKFRGLMMKENEDGSYVWYPVLTDGKRLTIPNGINAHAESPNEIFRTDVGIVSQIKAGKVDSNYDIVVDNKTGEEELALILPNYKEDDKGNKVKIIDLSDSERQEYEKKIESLLNEYRKLASSIKELRDREIRYETKLADMEIRVSQAEKERDIWATSAASLSKHMIAMTQQLASVLSGVQDLRISSILTEDLNRRLMYILNESREIMERYLPKELSEVEKEKVMESIKMAKELIPQITPKQIEKGEVTEKGSKPKKE